MVETGAAVISVDYRLAPKTRFPGAFGDALATVQDVATRIDEFGRNAQRIGLAGDAAGGGLAAATAIACRDRNLAAAAQLLIYPETTWLAVTPIRKRTPAFRPELKTLMVTLPPSR